MTYIDPRGKVLSHLDRIVGWSHGYKPAPVTVEWDLSNACVLKCVGCHFSHTHTKGPWAVSERTIPQVYDSTGQYADFELVTRAQVEMADAGVKGVIYSGGGEPTTHPRWVDILCEGFTAGLRQGMYTLGGLFTKQTAAAAAWWCDWVVVSLDAADAETYAAEKGVPASRFGAACNGIRWLADADRSVIGVSFLLHGGNWPRTAAMLSLARGLGATYTTFRPLIETSPEAPSVCTTDRGWVTDVYPSLLKLAQEPDVEVDPDRFLAYQGWNGHGYSECHGVRLNVTVTPDGRVWLCPQRRGIDGSCLGDLRIESFSDIWARHPGHYTVDNGCRVMCRLHPINEQLTIIAQPREHEAFV